MSVLMTAQELAAYLGCSTTKAYQMIATNAVPTCHLPGSTRKRAHKEQLDRMLSEQARTTMADAGGVLPSNRRTKCHTKEKDHRTGGSAGSIHVAVSRLDALLAPQTMPQQRH